MRKASRVVLVVTAVLAVLMLARCTLLGHSSKSGSAPGLVAGQLAPCPDKPNCVCSEFESDEEHWIAPIDYPGVAQERAWGAIAEVVAELGGEVVLADADYLAATFTSSLFRFVDDVELRLDPSATRIQVRSASRVGHSDMGVNRKRVEAIRRSFDAAQGGAE